MIIEQTPIVKNSRDVDVFLKTIGRESITVPHSNIDTPTRHCAASLARFIIIFSPFTPAFVPATCTAVPRAVIRFHTDIMVPKADAPLPALLPSSTRQEFLFVGAQLHEAALAEFRSL